MMVSDKLSSNINSNVQNISSCLPSNLNLINRSITIAENIRCNLIFISGIADKKDVHDVIIKPLLDKNVYLSGSGNNVINELLEKYIYCPEVAINNSINIICQEVLNGKCALLIEDLDKAIICNVTSSNYRRISESTTEKSILGSKESFVEDINLNITMLQRKIKNSNLKIEKYVIGQQTNTDVSLLYIKGTIDSLVLEKIKQKISAIKIPAVSYSGILEQLIDDKPFNIFPIGKTTEKPDKVVFDLIEGKAALLIAEYPGALIVPATLMEFFQGTEDYNEKPILANFSRILRFIAMLIVMTLEPIYLTLLYYNPELFPYKLISIVISSRQNIPFPPFIEILAMDLAVEILREGGLRLPNPIGTTLAIVGGIVIGEAATRAGLVSNITLFIVALTVISTFCIPNYQMAITMRFIRFPLLILAQIFGFYGLLIGYYFELVIITKIESFGVPYFSPFIPMRFSDISDTIIRGTIRNIFKKPKSLSPSKKTKQTIP